MLDVLPASQRVDERQWYLGTADAVTQNIDIIESYGVNYIIVLGRATTFTRWTTASCSRSMSTPAPT